MRYVTSVYTYLEKHARAVVVLMFAVIFCIGMLCADDYGMSWDEPTERNILQSNIDCAFRTLFPATYEDDRAQHPDFYNAIPALEDYVERDHGQAAYYPMGIVDFIMKWDSDLAYYNHSGRITMTANTPVPQAREQYFLRHIYNFALCFMAAIFLYLLVKLLLRRRVFAILAVLLYFGAPRMLGEMFFNCKDMAALAMLLPAMYFAAHFILRRKWSSAVLLALFGALSVNMRISTALFLVLAALCCVCCFAAQAKHSSKPATFSNWAALATSVILCPVLYYILTPAAWKNPVEFIGYVLGSSANFSRWNNLLLFDGQIVQNVPDLGVPELSSTYLPKMIALTLPIVTLVLILAGCCAAVALLVRGIIKRKYSCEYAIIFTTFVFTALSILLPIIMDSTLYNAWRHLYYLYGGMVVLACFGACMLWKLLKHPKVKFMCALRFALPCIIALELLWCGIWCILNHPYEYVYYNPLAYISSNAYDKYEADYWNISGRQVLEEMLEDTEGEVYVRPYDYQSADCFVKALVMLDEEDRARVKFGSWLDINYTLVNLSYYQIYSPKADGSAKTVEECIAELTYDGRREYYCVEVDGTPIMLLIKVGM